MSKKNKSDRIIVDGTIKMKDDLVDETVDFQTKERNSTHNTFQSPVAIDKNTSNKLITSFHTNTRNITFVLGNEKHIIDFQTVFNSCPKVSKNQNIYNNLNEVLIQLFINYSFNFNCS